MKNLIFGWLSRGEGIWFERWHFYAWGWRKKPHGKFKRVWRVLDMGTLESREI